jgi:hypothetical protein
MEFLFEPFKTEKKDAETSCLLFSGSTGTGTWRRNNGI